MLGKPWIFLISGFLSFKYHKQLVDWKMLRHLEALQAKSLLWKLLSTPKWGEVWWTFVPHYYFLPTTYRQDDNTDTAVGSFNCRGDTIWDLGRERLRCWIRLACRHVYRDHLDYTNGAGKTCPCGWHHSLGLGLGLYKCWVSLLCSWLWMWLAASSSCLDFPTMRDWNLEL